jgi:hypothetical protein
MSETDFQDIWSYLAPFVLAQKAVMILVHQVEEPLLQLPIIQVLNVTHIGKQLNSFRLVSPPCNQW